MAGRAARVRWLSSSKNRRRSTTRERLSSPLSRRLRIELLEDRRQLSITVNTLSDTTIPNDGLTTLREAIASAVPGETINFSVTGTISLNGTQLVINKSLSIEGPGAELLTVDAGGLSRGFDVDDNNFNSFIDVRIIGLTITRGRPVIDGGGGIRNAENLSIDACTISNNFPLSITLDNMLGGGILNRGILTLSNSTISGNSARQGGGIYNSGALTITDSTIEDNRVNDHPLNTFPPQIQFAFGGAIHSNDNAPFNITSSLTISGS